MGIPNTNTSKKISIHALLAESDIELAFLAINPITFLSTLSLRRATELNSNWISSIKFLSTLSLRRATSIGTLRTVSVRFLSTLSLRRATSTRIDTGNSIGDFYPRSPCGERRQHSAPNSGRIRFLSTLSLRRATKFLRIHQEQHTISIHALLAESDNRYGRPIDVQLVFLSTLSLRRATSCQRPCARPTTNFYPRSPCGERLHTCQDFFKNF